jgi:hypothetical protein
MPNRAPFLLNRSGALLALVSAAFAGEAGAAAGRTEFTIGGVTLARGGIEQPLARGTELDNGDVIRTNEGRAQIRFTDGSYVSLQPNTEFGIREYRFEQKTDGSERGFFGLVKGAMRTVTGLIGRVNRDRYQIATPTATVGIRGTGGVIQVLPDGSTLVIGTSGIWSLTNPAGSIDVPAGVSGLAPTDPNDPPSETGTQPTSGPAPLPEEESEFVQGDERTPTGDPLILAAPPPTITPLVSGPGYSAVVGFDSFRLDTVSDGDAVFNSQGQLTKLAISEFFGYELVSGTHADFGTDGILAWGRWTGDTLVPCEGMCNFTYGADDGVHYVIGLPTPTLPTSGSATYSLAGATRPTYVGGGVAPGTFTGTINVDFGLRGSGIAVDFDVSIGGKSYGLTGSTSTGSQFSLVSGQGLTATGCGASGCSARVNGFFSGASAERIGVGYHINDSSIGKDILGAAAFKKN